MATSTKAAPPYSIILVEDPSGGEVPSSIRGELISSTRSCIAVGCRSSSDGDTEFVLGPTAEADPGSPPAFSGSLETPNLKVIIRDVEGRIILECRTSSLDTNLRIWVNDPVEPDKIVVGIE